MWYCLSAVRRLSSIFSDDFSKDEPESSFMSLKAWLIGRLHIDCINKVIWKIPDNEGGGLLRTNEDTNYELGKGDLFFSDFSEIFIDFF